MKFKVGDRVRAKSNIFEENGKIGTIVKANISDYDVNFDEDIGGWSNAALNIKEGHGVSIKEKNLILLSKSTKQELLDMPVGTKIYTDAEDENYQEWLKVTKNSFVNGENDEYINEDDIEEDLTLEIYGDDYGTKIIKIEEPTYETVYDYSTEVQEMTISEIERELGHPIKIVKEN